MLLKPGSSLSKTNTEMPFLRMCLILSLVGLYFCRADEECGKRCVMDKDTLLCTDVPRCIPEGITRVHVNKASTDSAIITKSNFTGENWDHVTYLRLEDSDPNDHKLWKLYDASFVALESVKELQINLLDLWIYPNTLVGLSTLKTIDFTGCHTLTINDLIPLLNGTSKMAALNKLILSDWSMFTKHAFDFDDKLVDVLLPRNITEIVVSNSIINLLNATAIIQRMEHLQTLNLSLTRIAYIYHDHLQLRDTAHLKVFDISGIGLPWTLNVLPMKYVFKDRNSIFYFSDRNNVKSLFFSIQTINATGLLPKPFALEVTSQLIVPQKCHFLTKELEFKENNINRLDVKILGVGNFTWDLEYLGLSNNDLEFLHGSILACSPNLTKLDLSRNRLFIMHEEDPQQFEQLLSGVPALRNINLSNNNLTHIPHDFFKSSHNVSTIDLSYNSLTEFTFTVSGLINLRTIDLRSNNIMTLDTTSLHNLNSFPSVENKNEGTREVILTSNPISCAKCAAKPFLRWILSTRLVNITSQKFTCIDETGNRFAIDETVIAAVNYICIRSTIYIIVTFASIIVVMSVIAAVVRLRKRRGKLNKLAHRRVNIEKIREGIGPYEFPVFLSYSSKDDDFALNKVLPNLNENFRMITGNNHDRDLVCTGDENLRPGFYVHNEIDVCLDRASAVIILVTENYCTSEYCGSELEKAYMKRKPVVLMFKEYVSEELMSRTMKELYKRNVRILWTEHNGEYVLQTTWENVCTSIIDLIQ